MCAGNDLRLLPCSSRFVLPFCLQLMLACFKVPSDIWQTKYSDVLLIEPVLTNFTLSYQLRAFTDNRDDLSLGHVVVLLQLDWPSGETLFLKAVDKICQQGSFQYENFFNYVTSILFGCDGTFNHNWVRKVLSVIRLCCFWTLLYIFL